ncbi:MAG: hypothetical protein IT174_13160 [Acidobacteria bacterium]|nr:hypothetical protein [Acidobacteriota bacterium]
MKRCPECRRDYYDDTLLYCLDDGNALLEGPASPDEPTTMVLSRAHSGGDDGETDTRRFSSGNAPDDHVVASNSIAVLPFKNISADVENEYFCEGLAEELLNALAKIDELKVAARTSAFSFKNEKTDISEIGRKLGVAHVVEGSVRKAGERLRVAVQLLNASDGYHIWSETYDREMRDLFDLQDEITLSVIGALKLKLLGGEKRSILKRETENTEAYKAYLMGRFLRYAKNDHAGAAVAYEEAVRLDPSHAPSWLGLGESYMLRTHYALVRADQAGTRLKESLTRARSIQGETAEALYIEGFFAFIERDWRTCDEAYAKSFAIDPNNSRALGTYGVINSVLGRVEDAMTYFARSRESDPLAAYPYAMTGGGLANLQRPEDAMRFIEQAFAFEKDNSLALWMFCETCIALKRSDDGIAMVEAAMDVSRRPPFLLGILGCALAAAGRMQEAKQILAELRTRPADAPVLVHEACLLGAAGDKDAAFALLARAVDEYAPLAYYVGLPCFDILRDDPRFAAHVASLAIPRRNI